MPRLDELKKNSKRWARIFCVCILALLFVLLPARLLVNLLFPPPPLQQAAPCSRLIYASDGSLLRFTLAEDGQYRLWQPLSAMAEHSVDAILLKEDQYFYWHPGVNPAALVKAAFSTYLRGNRQGGSTITMQLARRLWGLNSRQVPGKIKQTALALWLEFRYSKQEILEAYLNLAPMGGNVEGLATAARIYFGKEASELTLPESLALAVLPQKPSQRADFGVEHQKARWRLAQQWRALHPESSLLTALDNFPVQRRSRAQLPFLAPHLSDLLLARYPDEENIVSTVDPAMQRLVERLARDYVAEQRHRGIVNAAILVVDRRNMAVRALLGSADFFNPALHGQVNGVIAKRSPGSTLKPFIYGLAIDQGLIHPMTVLRDRPDVFGAYRPENFDGRFVGPLTARDALTRSRNVPAVDLLNRLGRPNLYNLLIGAGVRLREEKRYGLALALGSAELSMEELVGLYAMLANDGIFRPLRYRQSDPSGLAVPLLSPQAAFMLRDMLSHYPRPGHAHGKKSRSQWLTAWKTGTSWSYRDAWTLGLSGDYVLAVWVGNFDGSANSSFVGLTAAAPLFFRLADALPLLTNEQPVRREPPEGLTRVEVCAASGELPNPWCPRLIKTWFIPGKSPIRTSKLHRPVVVDKESGKALCPPFDAEKVRIEVFEFWPSDMQALFAKAGLPRKTPPAAPGNCSWSGFADAGERPRILSPLSHVTYTLRLSRPEEKIELRAAADSSSSTLYWFAGSRYLGRHAAGDTFSWRPQQGGTYDLTVLDDYNRGEGRVLRVEFVP